MTLRQIGFLRWPGAVVAAVAAAVAAPALWAVRFALAEPGRRAMLAYWGALLAVSLPAMHRVAASRHLPTIIIRKVGLSDAPIQLLASHRQDRVHMMLTVA